VLSGADPERRSLCLRALGIAGTSEALPLVQAALKDADSEVADDAVRVLSAWKTRDAIPGLLELASAYGRAASASSLCADSSGSRLRNRTSPDARHC
jgi:HEAT repeat protein